MRRRENTNKTEKCKKKKKSAAVKPETLDVSKLKRLTEFFGTRERRSSVMAAFSDPPFSACTLFSVLIFSHVSLSLLSLLSSGSMSPVLLSIRHACFSGFHLLFFLYRISLDLLLVELNFLLRQNHPSTSRQHVIVFKLQSLLVCFPPLFHRVPRTPRACLSLFFSSLLLFLLST